MARPQVFQDPRLSGRLREFFPEAVARILRSLRRKLQENVCPLPIPCRPSGPAGAPGDGGVNVRDHARKNASGHRGRRLEPCHD